MSSTCKMLRLSALPVYLYKNLGPQLLLHSSPNFTAPASSCCCRHLSTSGKNQASSPNKDFVVSKVYQNRNPRNLEKMAIARKRVGWKFHAPRRDYYHKLVIQHSLRHTEVWVEHFSGEKVLSASTKEWAIRNQLHHCTDVAASASVGQVLAQRCLQSGITCLFFDDEEFPNPSDKITNIIQAFKDVNIALKEPPVDEPELMPGINYDGYNRYAEPKVWKEDYQNI